MKCGYRSLVELIDQILEEKEKIQKQNDKLQKNQTLEKSGKKKKKKKKKATKINNYNNPPKTYSLNFFNNNINLPTNNNDYDENYNNKKESHIKNSGLSNLLVIKKSKPIIKNDLNLQKRILNTNNNEFSQEKIITKKNSINNDYELNELNYNHALIHDKRSFCKYYISLIKEKNILIFSFCPIKDYNSIIIKTCIFSLSFSIYYSINFVFFNDAILHKIYEEGGKYDVFYFLPKIFFSFIISYYITSLIKIIFLSQRNIIKIKQEDLLSIAVEISYKVKKNLVIKYIIFFIVGIIFLFFFWMLLSSFGAVYPNTQIFIFKNTLISFAFGLVYPFFICLLPSALRISSLNNGKKDSECMYKISNLIQKF